MINTAQPVFTIEFTFTDAITWLIIGLIAGFLARLVIRGNGFSMVTNIGIGLAGAFVGGTLFSILRIPAPGFLAGGITLPYFDIVVAFIGAVLVLLVFDGLRRRGYWRGGYRRYGRYE